MRILNDYFPNTDNNIWIIEDIHDYCNEAQESKSFINSKLYYILDKLYDVCDYMVLWYGSEYDDLDEVYSKKGLFEYVEHCLKNPCCEIYLRIDKMKSYTRTKK